MAGWQYEGAPGRGEGGQKSLWTCLLQADLPAPFVQQYTLAGFGCTKYNFDGIESDTIITASIINKEEKKTMHVHHKYNYSVFLIPVLWEERRQHL